MGFRVGTFIFLLSFITSFITIDARANLGLDPIHQAIELVGLQNSFLDVCKIVGSDSKQECYANSYVIPSSGSVSAKELESVLNKEFMGKVHLSSKGMMDQALSHGIHDLLQKMDVPERSKEHFQATRKVLMETARNSMLKSTSWAEGKLWSPLEQGKVVVILRRDVKYDLTEVLLLGRSASAGTF
jgi:hypothetical protein